MIRRVRVYGSMETKRQEDHLHSAPVIELLWRSRRSQDGKGEGEDEDEDDLSMRLKVRQMTQLLVDTSLLLGSSLEGVHLHDIPLSFVRNSHTPERLRAMQLRVTMSDCKRLRATASDCERLRATIDCD